LSDIALLIFHRRSGWFWKTGLD